MLNTESLKKNYQFALVYNRGKSYTSRTMVVFVLRNNLCMNRLGMSVSKKIGNSVVRNRVRRRIRESYRLLEKDILQENCGMDIVVIARRPIVSEDFDKIKSGFLYLFKKVTA